MYEMALLALNVVVNHTLWYQGSSLLARWIRRACGRSLPWPCLLRMPSRGWIFFFFSIPNAIENLLWHAPTLPCRIVARDGRCTTVHTVQYSSSA